MYQKTAMGLFVSNW